MRLRRIRLIGAAIWVPLALGACGLTRPPAQATAPIPAQFNAPLPPTSAISAALPHGGSVPALADWFRQLDDPVLVEIIQSAEAASPNLASAAARVAEARSTRIQAGAALLPGLDGSLSGSRGNSSSFGASGASAASGSSAGAATSSGAAGAAPAIGSAGGGFGGAAPLTTLSAGLQSRWEIDLFGRLRADRDAASQREAGADAKWHEARVAIAAEATNAYFAERACRQQLDVAENDTRSRSETARLTGLSAGAGFTAPADAALARAGASDSSARLTQQRATCAVQRKALVQLTGIDELALEQKLAAAPVQRALPAISSIASVPAQMLAQRPDVFAAEQAVSAANADVGSAEAERYPKLTLSGNISRLQIRASGFRESFSSWSVGPLTLTVPLLDGGARVANVDAAKARYEESASLYRANVRQAVREVEEALVNLDGTAARTGDADSAVQGYQTSFNATQARYDSGLASLFELEDSRRTLFAAQTARVSLQRERTEAWVALYRAMGGGWVRPDSPSSVAKTTATPTP